MQTLIGTARKLIDRAQHAGNFTIDGHTPTAEERAVAAEARRLNTAIERSMDRGSAEELPDLLDLYDITYRIAFGRLPDPDYIDRQVGRIMAAWQKGGSRMEESQIMQILAPRVTARCFHGSGYLAADRQRSRVADRRNSQAAEECRIYSALLGGWTTALLTHGRFPGTTTRETYLRLAILLRQPQEAIESQGAQESLPSLKPWIAKRFQETDLSRLSTPILQAYRRYQQSQFPSLIDYAEYRRRDHRIQAELCRRPGSW